ncbi:MAG: glycosyltransferase [Microthrixaceae bacterium]
MSGAKATVRRAVTRALPPGSPGRGYALVALDAYREGRNSLRRLADSVAVMHDDGRRAPDLGTWQARTRVGPDELARMEHVSATSANPTQVHAFVVADGGPADRSVRCLEQQVWRRTAHRVGPLSEVPAWVDGLPDDAMAVVLRSGDTIDRDVAFRVADALWSNPSLHLVTWDDDVAGERDPRFAPPTWAPELLLSTNPTGRSFAVRVDRLRGAGGFDPTSPDPWWDLLLRLDPHPDRVAHLEGAPGHVVDRRRAPVAAMAPAVTAALARRGWPATVDVRDGHIRLRWDLPAWPRASVVVPTRHNRPLLESLVPTLRGTEYPDWELVVIDNGGRTDEKDAYYAELLDGLDARVIWWDEPFNYGTVNNHAVAQTDGDVVVLLNDDTETRSPGWLTELVGWATRDEIGTVGVQLVNGDGVIQHGGVVIGMSGFANHLFAGLAPHSDTVLGSTDFYRDTSANTAACVALRRTVWDEIGGLDERFDLLGSDVVLGLDAMGLGLRNVTTPAIDVRHMESVTRGAEVPVHDMYASYWRYHRWLKVGDPYFPTALSLKGPELQLRSGHEPSALEQVGPLLGRQFGVFRQTATEAEALMLADLCRLPDGRIDELAAEHAAVVGSRPVRTVNWFIPDVENPFYGGIATAFRIAEHLRAHHGVENRFVVWSAPNEEWFRSAIRAIFPGLADSPIVFHDGSLGDRLDDLPSCDVAVATQWPTAYAVAAFRGATRRFYLVQDFEPVFHPAGTLYALAEESYKLGLYGICNTVSMGRFYREDYGGTGSHFVPAVDTDVFHARGRPERDPDDPVRLFLYARPGHWRNCWELVSLALDELKATYGRRLTVVTAGSWARPEDLGRGIDHLGLLDYRATGDLYRSCDIGISLTVSPHPSYLPLELMACGAAVVAFDLPPGYWILDDGVDCLLSRRTVPSLVSNVGRLIDDAALRARLQRGGLDRVARHHSDWDSALSRIYHQLCDPEAFDRRDRRIDALGDGPVTGQVLRGLAPVPASG